MKWIPLDGYHQKPKDNELVILSDEESIFYDMVYIRSFSHDGRDYKEGWYHINGVAPMDINPTHYIILSLP